MGANRSECRQDLRRILRGFAEELGVGSRSQPGQSAGRNRTDAQGNFLLDGDLLAEESRGNLVWGKDRLVALLGVNDLAVVDTDDVILITKLERSPDVRRLVAALKAKGRENLT